MVAEQRKVIVLDEPTYGQDWANTCELMEFIQQLCSTGHLVIMATHDLELAKKYCSHIIALPFSPQVTAPAASRSTKLAVFSTAFNPLTLFIALVPLMVMIFVLKNPVVNFSLLSVSSLAMLLAGANRTRALGSILGSWLVAAFMIWMFSDNDVLSMASRLNDVGTSYAAGSGIGALIALVLLSGIYSAPTKMLVSLNQTFKSALPNHFRRYRGGEFYYPLPERLQSTANRKSPAWSRAALRDFCAGSALGRLTGSVGDSRRSTR
ncbi:Putative HMP/thiamine import ATP-binding protein YkoD [Mobiluncus curtisii]|uniref:HMP/thiamine import ATP-binding protein YkoD n=1 Tax=Mobiluncus curtisii TaxID=2051 RepID=A0A2X3BL39_9ACTO|nr:Putative HMP/thiamine import ATP-binding protein YkoD [Mobiluncus curtisii]